MEIKDVRDEINRIAGQSYTTAETVRAVLNTMLDFSDEKIAANIKSIEAILKKLAGVDITLNQHKELIDTNTPKVTELQNLVKNHEARLIILENEEQNGGFQQFSIQAPIKDTKQLLELRYSFVILSGKILNYTFYIKALTDLNNIQASDYSFNIANSDLAIELSKFFQTNNHSPSYVVTINSPTMAEKKYQRLLTTTIGFRTDGKNNEFTHRFYPYDRIEGQKPDAPGLIQDDEIFTTVVYNGYEVI